MENVNPELVGAGAAILYMLIAFLMGGGTVLLSVGLVVRSILKSPVIIRFLEKLAEGADPALLETIRDMVKLGNEVTDGIPADQKELAALAKVMKELPGQA